MPADEIVRISVLPFNMVNAHLIRNDTGASSSTWAEVAVRRIQVGAAHA
jgi:hypothetical protein